MKCCIECNHPIDNDYDGENCPACEAPLVSEEIVEEFLEEDGMLVNDIDEDDDFEDFDDEDEHLEDDEYLDDLEDEDD
jgi:hypothetical protein